VARLQSSERLFYIDPLLARGWNGGEAELKKGSIASGGPEAFSVFEPQGFETEAVTLQENRAGIEHESAD